MVNSNPETVSTDFDASTRLYFEPLDEESVLEVIAAESPPGDEPLPALIQFGGQTPLNLAPALEDAGVALPGIDVEAIDRVEERTRFAEMVDGLGLAQPQGGIATSLDEALVVAERVGYPVLVRPSFVIGGLAIDFCYGPEDLERQLATATLLAAERPVRIDAFLEGLEVDVDAVSDGHDVLIPGLLEHVERAGVHSGDSTAFFPPQRLAPDEERRIVEAMRRICLETGVRGLVNAQFIVRDGEVFVLEVNPRASRTVPFLSKVTGVPMVDVATRVAGGARLAELGWRDGLLPRPGFVAVKAPVFSTAKLRGVDPSLGPGMQSTGEVIGIHHDGRVALAKALTAAALHPPLPGPAGADVLVSIAPRDEARAGELGGALADAGYRFVATPGTAAALRRHGHAVREVALPDDVGSPHPSVLDVIAGGSIALIVCTPMPRPGIVLDAAAIRHAAIAEGIVCMTTMDSAIAAARALEAGVQARLDDVRSLDAWLLPTAGS
jgi:carbamoyl-phosphate synthase large subunit